MNLATGRRNEDLVGPESKELLRFKILRLLVIAFWLKMALMK